MYEGVINILKPPGMTSSNVVSDVRRVLSEKRVGHTGTLDPGAAGVLPVCVGRATRLFDFLVDKQKEYIAEVCFGITTDTQDAYGVVNKTVDCNITTQMLMSVLPEFMGDIEQKAPMYSAVSINGTRLYKLARNGVSVERAFRRTTIYDLTLLDATTKNRYLLYIKCSKGTYVRTLLNDIGERLGVGAYMSFLLRTASGNFTIDNAYTLCELEEAKSKGLLKDAIIPVEHVLSFLTSAHLEGKRTVRLFTNGAPVDDYTLEDNYQNASVVRVYDGTSFLGIGKLSNAKLSLAVLFADNHDI